MATVTVDNSDLTDMRRMIETFRGGSKIVIVRATNDALSGVKTQSAKLIGAKVTAKAAEIKKHFAVKKMTFAQMSAVIDCTGKPLALAKYSVNKVKSGVSAKVKKANARKIIKHAFIATMKSGHKGVYWREDKRRGRVWPVGKPRRVPTWKSPHPGEIYRLDLHELYGPPIPEIYNDPEIIGPTMTDANARLQARLKYHTDRLFERAR